MSYYCTANFTTQLREGVTEAQVREIVSRVMGEEMVFEGGQWHTAPVSALILNGDLTVYVADTVDGLFEKRFEELCAEVAAISEDAFESTFETDDGPTAAGTTASKIWGGTPEAVRALELANSVLELEDAARKTLAATGTKLVACDLKALATFELIAGVTFCAPNDAGEMEPLVSVDLCRANDHVLRRQIIDQAHTLAALLANAAGKHNLLVVEARSLMPTSLPMGEQQLAALSEGEGSDKPAAARQRG